MDMQSPRPARTSRTDATLGELFEDLIDDGRALVKAEVGIAEAKIAHRARLAAVPAGMFAAAAGFGLVTIMAVAAAVVIALSAAIGLLAAVIVVALMCALAAFLLAKAAGEKMKVVTSKPSIDAFRGVGK